MNERRFVNQHQPQTLYMATVLCYFDAVLLLIFGGVFSPIGLAFIAGFALGGFGVANDKRWGYVLAVIVSSLWVLLVIATGGAAAFRFPNILNLIFDGVLVALLVHPMSRDYQRIWFT